MCRQGRAFAGAVPKADMGQLSQALTEVVDQLRPSPDEQERQKVAFEQVRSTLLCQWPAAKVHLFGSTANCLSICNNNDIDVCLELPEGIEDQVTPGFICWPADELSIQARKAALLLCLRVSFSVPAVACAVAMSVPQCIILVGRRITLMHIASHVPLRCILNLLPGSAEGS